MNKKNREKRKAKRAKHRYEGGYLILELLAKDIESHLAAYKPENVDKWTKEQWMELIEMHINRWRRICFRRMEG